MKKFLKIILIIIILLVVIFGGIFLVNTLREKSEISKQKSEISEWPDYYKKIAEEKCKGKSYYSECCLSGLRHMVANGYKLANENEECPKGLKENMLWCEGTLIWCEPEK